LKRGIRLGQGMIVHGIKSILGIDQTGAVKGNGQPRPLYACLLRLQAGRLETNLRLAKFCEAEVLELLGPNALPALIIVDSVLGLPQSTKVSIQRLLAEAANFTFADQAFGAQVAHQFFLSFLSDSQSSSKEFPMRKVELLCGANSVFKLRPFQRNIGCGSFRVLKELGQKPDWFRVWPFDKFVAEGITIAEGYPSQMWQDLFGVKRKHASSVFENYLQENYSATPSPRTADDADACVLALGGKRLLEENYFQIAPSTLMQAEGWIAGIKANETGILS
jgi:hypothetical protein